VNQANNSTRLLSESLTILQNMTPNFLTSVFQNIFIQTMIEKSTELLDRQAEKYL